MEGKESSEVESEIGKKIAARWRLRERGEREQ